MRTIYVVLASKHYDTSPKVLRAFDTQAEADGLKELIESCSPSRQIEVVPTQLCGEPVLPTPFPDLLRDPPPNPWPPRPIGIGTTSGDPFVASSNADA